MRELRTIRQCWGNTKSSTTDTLWLRSSWRSRLRMRRSRGGSGPVRTALQQERKSEWHYRVTKEKEKWLVSAKISKKIQKNWVTYLEKCRVFIKHWHVRQYLLFFCFSRHRRQNEGQRDLHSNYKVITVFWSSKAKWNDRGDKRWLMSRNVISVNLWQQ